MQISSSLMFDRSAARLGSLMSTAVKLQTQIATGKKFTSPSENIVVAQQVAEFDRQEADAAAYAGNMNLSGALLQQADSTLDSITEQVQRATELTTRAANGSLSVADRKVIGNELQSIVEALVGLGNANDSSGRPLFGSASGTPAVIDNKDGTFTYNTAPKLSEIPIGDNVTIQATETSARIFKSGTTDILATLSALATALQAGDATGASAQAALDPLKEAGEQISNVQASVGARGARVDLQQTLQQNVAADRAELRSSLEDADIVQAAADLMKTKTILDATQSSFAKLSQLSLFTYLR